MSQRQRLEELPLFLGIEGGGTRTVAILADSADHLLKRVEAGPANLRLLGDTQLVELLRSLADALRQPRAVCIGLAGLRTEADRSRVLKAAASVWPDALRTACADLDTALAAADTLPAGHSLARVLVLSGTGSCCFGRDGGGRTAKIGGWGHLLGDKSSAYEIGLRALKAVVYYYDRDGKWPSLGAQILRALQLNAPHDLIAWTQQAEKKDIAALALEVFAAWGRRDKIAGDILTAAAANLGKDAAHCANRLAPRGALVQFIFAGSVLLKQPRFAKLVSRQLTELWPGARVTKLRSEGAWGAVRLAREAWLRESPGISGRLAGKGARSLPAGERSGDASAETGAPNSTELDTLIPEPTGPSPTEQRNPRSSHLDKMPLLKAVRLMLTEEAKIPSILLAQEKRIARCILCIERAFRQGGRLFYVGAGTSGRLGALDASECPPTFRTPPDQVQGIIAGGQQALWQSIEGAEDDAAAGADAIRFRGITRKDVVVGIAASGRTPFVWGALHAAKRCQAKTILISLNPRLRISRAQKPDWVITADLGPEVLTGSTRLKAGTATKLLLNAFTTLSMVRLGKVISNLMVDLNPSNRKLRQRAVRIVRELTGAADSDAAKALEQADWVITKALRRLGLPKRSSPATECSTGRESAAASRAEPKARQSEPRHSSARR